MVRAARRAHLRGATPILNLRGGTWAGSEVSIFVRSDAASIQAERSSQRPKVERLSASPLLLVFHRPKQDVDLLTPPLAAHGVARRLAGQGT